MYIGFGWRVKGNKETAENLANFLINCDLNNITPLEPIKSLENNSIMLYYREMHFPFKTSGSWACGDDIYCHLLTSSEIRRARKNKEILVVSLLKKLDKEGIVLPFFDKLYEVPGIVSDRVSYINNNKEHENFKLSEVLGKSTNACSEKLFSENFTELNIPDYTAKAVSLTKWFTQQGPETIYRGNYFFNRGSVFLQDISIEIKKEIKLKKEAIEKCPLKVTDLETARENDVFKPRKMKFIDKVGDKFIIKKTELSSGLSSNLLIINKDYGDKCRSGAIYSPTRTEDLTTLETLAYWLLENNVPQKEAKLEEKVKTTEESVTSGGGG